MSPLKTLYYFAPVRDDSLRPPPPTDTRPLADLPLYQLLPHPPRRRLRGPPRDPSTRLHHDLQQLLPYLPPKPLSRLPHFALGHGPLAQQGRVSPSPGVPGSDRS